MYQLENYCGIYQEEVVPFNNTDAISDFSEFFAATQGGDIRFAIAGVRAHGTSAWLMDTQVS
ncbi:MAG TPA: hypothetical protein VFQ78_04865 [Candidatus Udaeobacter sp.]|nr:hypothetical protein [Candidatus Udaeobacter sp.]